MIIENLWLTVGLITSCHGINGQVKVKSLSDFEERFLKKGIRWLQKENEPPSKIELISGFKQPGKETFIVKLQGINTRNHAEQLKKYKILVKTNKLPKLKKDEFHLLELINLQVKTFENDELKIIGKVINLENEKNNLLVSNTGPSGLVQDDGKIIKLLDYDVERNEIVFPNFSSEKTFYTKFGDKPILFLFIFFMGLNIFWKIN